MNDIIKITTPFIKLDSFLKLSNFVSSGGEAKAFIQEGKVAINEEICLQRGKKIYPGDKVSYNGQTVTVSKA
ncbi:MAG: RNA-binding S4 domain-containing protein [Clostridiaceae bacterium]|nr:RNA-binding S4 domain-containing protein [Clostridiaceae bacterium]